MIKWEIVESARGGFVAMKVGRPRKGILAGYKPGFVCGTVVYESMLFGTYDEAEKYITRKENISSTVEIADI